MLRQKETDLNIKNRGPNIISKTPKPTQKEDRDIYKHHHNQRITIIMPCIYMSAWIDEKKIP